MSAKKILTLVFLFATDPTGNRRVLLGMKKRGFGVGLWNGFGGKVEPGETIEQGARREVQEECGLVCGALRRAGVLWFEFGTDPMGLECHLYVGDVDAEAEGTETEEMRPQWFPAESVPFELMWADDSIWWPYVLSNRPFSAAFWFGEDKKTILRQKVELVEALPAGWDVDIKDWA
ncbi:Nudix (Nucleoside diphosphate linked moiety X)-type motif 1 [Geranomyces variabilis]|nr:Nudix (Nucleoside diphosphate linked moiety X)-type motif 1 [Geranomyces variabilis]